MATTEARTSQMMVVAIGKVPPNAITASGVETSTAMKPDLMPAISDAAMTAG